MDERELVSPDGQLRLLVVSPDGDITVGFADCPSHTHGDILASQYGVSEEPAVEKFVSDIIEGRHVIAVWRVDGRVRDIWVPEHEGLTLQQELADLALNCMQGETVEFRRWDGSKVQVPSANNVG